MEAKQYATKQPIGHWRNQRGNKKIPGGKWNQKYNDPRLKFMAIQTYPMKQENPKTTKFNT